MRRRRCCISLFLRRDLSKELQYVYEDGEADEEHEADGVDDRLHLAVERFAAHPLDGANTILEPSSAGMGSRLNTARLTPIYAAISKNCCTLREAISEVRRMVVIGPPKASSPRCPVNSCPSTLKMVPPMRKE